jgi:hypothetical protein
MDTIRDICLQLLHSKAVLFDEGRLHKDWIFVMHSKCAWELLKTADDWELTYIEGLNAFRGIPIIETNFAPTDFVRLVPRSEKAETLAEAVILES